MIWFNCGFSEALQSQLETYKWREHFSTVHLVSDQSTVNLKSQYLNTLYNPKWCTNKF